MTLDELQQLQTTSLSKGEIGGVGQYSVHWPSLPNIEDPQDPWANLLMTKPRLQTLIKELAKAELP